ncbi:Signal transduction histidine kinase regulating C4-dicarboxylate transport system [Desulfuromusa kysingii]|uniref:histidine kinase n=1 Tax=Desulfuromusa kysingii TaxID=37625 RepID=A0A1H4AF77_9BACT|nr:ATP-binding protein [Desulfuromusa kysingii]SEA34669.1 Signal transduction histidine kinase regulating C4-dicarboxylate transport system [Desulfuromusa kysingii]
MKLRTKVMMILVLSVVVVMGGSGLFFLEQYKAAFRNSVYESINSIAENTAQSLADYLRIQHDVAKHIGIMIPPEVIKHHQFTWIEEYFSKYFKDFDQFTNGFFFLDKNGILQADYPVHPELHGKDFSFRPYFQETMETQQGIIDQPYRSTRTDEGVLTFTVYLKDENDEPLGMVGASVPLEANDILGKIRTNRVGKTGYSYVFDKTRLMVLHPNAERILTRDVPVGANKMFDAAIDGFAGTAETVTSKGIKMFVAFQPVLMTDWIVATQVPIADALAPLWANQQLFILFICLGSASSALVGSYFVHRSMRDLETLESITANLSIPEKTTKNIEEALVAETEKLEILSKHVEFGPLSRIINELYHRLVGSFVELQEITGKLNDAYQLLKSSQSQILQQEKMASVGQLAAGIAHEINNPMGFINSNLSAMKRYQGKFSKYIHQLEDYLDLVAPYEVLNQQKGLKKDQKIDYMFEDIEDLIDESIEGAARVIKIVQDLKSFSRLDQSDFAKADINKCLESTIAIAWNEIKYKVTLVKEYGEVPMIDCYPQHLNQVFLNILLNAAQAIPDTGNIKVKTWTEQDKINISISDNGIGIPEDIKERIFEPFFTTKDVGKGTGLGMSISYEIIKKHKGRITLDSLEGVGTTFRLELPLKSEGMTNA